MPASTFIPPTDADLILSPAVTLTANTNGPALDLGQGYAPGGLGDIMAGVVNVAALKTSAGNETYTFKLQQSADGSNGWADIGVTVAATTIGTLVVRGILTTRFVRLVLAVGGTSPSITYSSLAGMS
jgi:hypothetical protein